MVPLRQAQWGPLHAYVVGKDKAGGRPQRSQPAVPVFVCVLYQTAAVNVPTGKVLLGYDPAGRLRARTTTGVDFFVRSINNQWQFTAAGMHWATVRGLV